MNSFSCSPIATPVTALGNAIWHPTPVTDPDVPLALRPWLGEFGSLTRKLREQGQQVSVTLLSQGWQQQGALWQRQIWLCADGMPWLWGLSEASAESVAICPELLLQGERPIGDWIFTVGTGRLSLEWARFDGASDMSAVLQQWRMPEQHPLWARRSILRLPTMGADVEANLQLTELFLPGCGLYQAE